MQKIKVETTPAFLPLYQNNHNIFVFYGGRGGQKSTAVAVFLILESIKKPIKILCTREFQGSIKDSVYALIRGWVENLGLNKFFIFKKNKIETINGSEFLFYGTKKNIQSIKSIFNISITWIEEGDSFSKESWEILEPSVNRFDKDYKIIITYNPNKTYDFFTQYFVNGARGAESNVYLCKVNIQDNPFAPLALLQNMEFDKQNLNIKEFEKKWLGIPYDFSDDSIFAKCELSPIEYFSFDRNDFTRIVVACDPATTSKDYSNEYGIFVVGKRKSGEIVGLADYSDKYTPRGFVKKVSLACYEWQTQNVVVEVNNGGDFIKSAILEYDNSLIVNEVRATQDKVTRALPVASLIEAKKVTFGNIFSELFRQMQLLSNKGYLGQKGESPDRLDGFMWGVYDLANIRDKGTSASVFKPSYFEYKEDFYKNAMVIVKNVCYLTHYNNAWCGVVFSVYKLNADLRFLFIDSFAINDLSEIDLSEFSAVYCENIGICKDLPYKKYTSITPFNLDIISLEILPKLKSGLVEILPKFKERQSVSGFFGNILLNELMDFSLESKQKFYTLKPFFDFCKNELK